MELPKHVFRKYDIRGSAEDELSNEFARRLGRAFVDQVAPTGGRVTVGRDCRLSSERLFAALTRGILDAGVDVADIGIGPTPMLYAAAHALGAEASIMITGSHNPAADNGFKMMRGVDGFFGADIQALRARVEAGPVGPSRPAGALRRVDFNGRYLSTLTKGIRLGPEPLRVVVDAGNGAGGPLAIAAMRRLGLEPLPLFCDMDGSFPNHHPDPTVPENLAALVKKVREVGARVGLAYDGDADRLGAVDADGRIVWGDELMILFARDVLRHHPGATILGEVKCSQRLYDDIARRGGRPIMWKAGHSLIKAKMKAEGALLAGEMSGHLFFADRYDGYDDALYASLRLLELLSWDNRSLGEMLSDVPASYSTPELRIACPEAAKREVVRAVRVRLRARGLPVVDVDGARVSFGNAAEPAWGLVRASNTGPILVMRFEATSPSQLEAIRADVETIVRGELARRAA
jgi:phosphomannomutase / phosphoglucomutase